MNRDTVDSRPRIDAADIPRRGGELRPESWRWSWTVGGIESSVGARACPEGPAVELSYFDRHDNPYRYLVRVELEPCHAPGRPTGTARAWWRCPNARCGRRCKHLYLAGRHFVCRTCADLTYATAQASGDPVGYALASGVGGIAAAERLRRRLARARNPIRIARLRTRLARLEKLEAGAWCMREVVWNSTP